MTDSASSLRRLADSLYGLAHTRLELVGIEIAEEKERALGIALTAIGMMVFVMMTFITVDLLVAAIFWDNYRWEAMAALVLIWAGLAGGGIWKLRKLLRESPNPFASTLAELDKDRAMLSALVSESAQQP
jgi:uncharacterized membrane protein YqjE